MVSPLLLLSPIFYPLSALPEAWRPALAANPHLHHRECAGGHGRAGGSTHRYASHCLRGCRPLRWLSLVR
jgi:hypothetical protein